MYSVVLTTAPSRDVALGLARALVERRFAACVNVMPATSVYRWQGEVQEDEEHLMVVKTRSENVKAISSLLSEMHPYELPEVVAIRVEDGSPTYLDWVGAETGGPTV